jgi:hypothetical protein
MSLFLTTLSVLAVWALLTLLVIALLLVLKVLESVRGSLRKIAMGVRAIDQETKPLGAHADALATTLARVDSIETATRRLHVVTDMLGRR